MTADLQQPDMQLLHHLLRAVGKTIDATALPSFSARAPQSLTDSINRLAAHGCAIEHDLRGTRLIRSGLGVWSDYLNHALADSPCRTIEVYQRTTSTQDLVKARADTPLLIFADEQTGGRGRLGRSWHAPPGSGLLFSLTHHPQTDQPGSIDRASFLTAVALTRAIEQLTGSGPIQISWPNDLVIEKQKLAGILVESVRNPDGTTSLVIGVGINVALARKDLVGMPDDVRHRATSLHMHGWKQDRLYVAECVIREIDQCLRSSDLQPMIEAWRLRNLYRDQTIRLRSDGRVIQGTVIDLAPDTGLILRRDTGEIVHLPAATTSVLP